MTVSYCGNFPRLVFYWKGSVWKAVWKELIIWLLLFYAARLCLRYTGKDMSLSMNIVITFSKYVSEIPIEFMLGFYVYRIITNWWQQVLLIPWPDDAMALVDVVLFGSDYDSRIMRHTIARYLILCQVMALRKVSIRVRKRFPTIDHLVSAGLMTKVEHQVYSSLPNEFVKWQIPLTWAQNIITPLVGSDAEDRISPVIASSLYAEFNKIKGSLRQTMTYDWTGIPLVYTQAVGFGLYGYFGMSLLGRQLINKTFDLGFPLLTVLKFVFYMGWFKVAQDIMRPFGEFDDDIELNYLLDRHLQTAFTFADFACEQVCELRTDDFSDQFAGAKSANSFAIPHTKLSYLDFNNPPTDHNCLKPSKNDDLEFLNVESTKDSEQKHAQYDKDIMLF